MAADAIAAATAQANAAGLVVGSQYSIAFNGGLVLAEVVRFEATGQVVGKYPDGKLYYMGDTVFATVSNIQAAQQQQRQVSPLV